MRNRIFVTAIGTDSGKTLVSAILCEGLKADYWKPIQSGLPRDSETIKSLITNTKTYIHPETYLLKTPASPHAAADIDGVQIFLENFKLPLIENILIIEGAGGTMVPLNNKNFIIDLIPLFSAEIVLVSNLYLGSINHTLLTINELKRRDLKVKGIIFNGQRNEYSENFILEYSGYKCLLNIEKEDYIDKDMVRIYAQKLHENWND